MCYLNHAIGLYRESERIRKLEIDYTLAEDKREKQTLRVAIINLRQAKQG